MKARFRRENEFLFVDLIGQLNFETAQPFHNTCMQKLLSERVVFNLKDLQFVGSSGITPFLQTLREFSLANPHPVKLVGASSEFRRIFMADPIHNLEIFDESGPSLL